MKSDLFLIQAIKEMEKREDVYDSPGGERSMERTVAVFNELTGHNLTEEQGWKFMCCLKLVRSGKGKFQADDYIDLSAYAGLAGEAAAKGQFD